MSEYTITRREFVGVMAALPFVGGAIEQPQDTFEIAMDDFPPIVAEGFADGRVVVTHDGERWAIKEFPERGYWVAESRRPGPWKCLIYNYAPETHDLDVLAARLTALK